MLTLDISKLEQFVDSGTYEHALTGISEHADVLHNGSGAGAELRGWMTLPQTSSAYLAASKKDMAVIKFTGAPDEIHFLAMDSKN